MSESYTTHVVSLQLANDYTHYQACASLAEQHPEPYPLARALHTYVRDCLDLASSNLTPLQADMLRAALDDVDFSSIAGEFLDV